MFLSNDVLSDSARLTSISAAFLKPENEAVDSLLAVLDLDAAARARAERRARNLITTLRGRHTASSVLQVFLRKFGLSTDEGLVLMCLAEALLRIPDARTIDALISEKLSGVDWQKHLGRSETFVINASILGLTIADWIVDQDRNALAAKSTSVLSRLIVRCGESVVRTDRKSVV